MKNEKMNIVKIAKIEKLIEKSILSKGKMEFCFISIPGIGKSQLVIKTCQRLGKTLAILTPSTTTQEDITRYTNHQLWGNNQCQRNTNQNIKNHAHLGWTWMCYS